MTFGVIDGLTKQYILSCNMQSWLHSGRGYVLYYKVTQLQTYLSKYQKYGFIIWT